MKINKIAKLCKEAKKICVLLTDDGPWIGTGMAMYFLPALKGISEEGIYAVLNVSEKDRKSTPIHYVSAKDLDTADINENKTDYPTYVFKLSLCYKGIGMSGLIGNERVKLYYTDYAAPLDHDTEFYFRGDKIYCKKGMMLQAIMMPVNGVYEEMLNELEYVVHHIRSLAEESDEW